MTQRRFQIPEGHRPHRRVVIVPASTLCQLFLEVGATCPETDETAMWSAWTRLLQRLHQDGYVAVQQHTGKEWV